MKKTCSSSSSWTGKIVLGLVATLAVLPYIHAQTSLPPWALGDSTTRCFTSPKNWTLPGEPIDIQGVVINLLNLPVTVTAGQPLGPAPAISVHFDPVFSTYANNLAQITPAPNTTDFQSVCFNRVPLNGTVACPATGSDQTNCCLPHIQFHACRQDIDPACEPWSFRNSSGIQPQEQVFTSARSKQGYSETVYEFPDWQLPNEQTWIVLAHVKVLNIQCAAGTIVKAIAAPVDPPKTITATEAPKETFPKWAIGVCVAGAAWLVLMVVFISYLINRKKKNRAAKTASAAAASTKENGSDIQPKPDMHEVIHVPMMPGNRGYSILQHPSQSPQHQPVPQSPQHVSFQQHQQPMVSQAYPHQLILTSSPSGSTSPSDHRMSFTQQQQEQQLYNPFAGTSHVGVPSMFSNSNNHPQLQQQQQQHPATQSFAQYQPVFSQGMQPQQQPHMPSLYLPDPNSVAAATAAVSGPPQQQQQQQQGYFPPLAATTAASPNMYHDSVIAMSDHMSLPQGTPVSSSPSIPTTTTNPQPSTSSPAQPPVTPDSPHTPLHSSGTLLPGYPGPPQSPEPFSMAGLYVAKVDYSPRNPDELMVRVGQAVQIEAEGQDAGWALGENLATKERGCVPLIVLQDVSTIKHGVN